MSATAPDLVGAYDPRVVVLSIVIAIAASFAALDLTGRVTANHGRRRPVWLLGGAFVQGVGIWSMHYTGMLAFTLPVPVWYDWPTALASFGIAFAQALLAFVVVSRPQMLAARTAVASLLMGAAISGLHYTAMASMRVPAECHYSTPLLALSILFAIGFSWLSLRLTFTFRGGAGVLQRVAGALAMGAALCVMHYTAMSAASFTALLTVPDLSHAVYISFLGIVAIASTALTVLAIAVVSCAVNRLTQHREALRTTAEQLRILAKNASRAREQEAARIGRELHDELGAALTGLKWDVESIGNALAQPPDEQTAARLRKQLAATLKVIDSLIGAVRRIASELRPRILDDLGVIEAIEWQAQQFEARTGIACRCDCSLEGVELTKEASTAIFRIFQEALTNVLRHAGATEVQVNVSVQSNVFMLRVRDNGRGITDEERSSEGAIGLLGMRERAALIGATVDIIGSPGHGTEVVVRLPLGNEPLRADVTSQRRNSATSASGG